MKQLGLPGSFEGGPVEDPPAVSLGLTWCRNVEDGDDDKTLHCLSLGSI